MLRHHLSLCAIVLLSSPLLAACSDSGSPGDRDASARGDAALYGDAGSQGDADDDAGPAQPALYFFAIHCEPFHDEPGAVNILEESYATLQQMVAAADARHVKLTVMLTPQWADMIASSAQRTTEVAAWAAHGHELAAHHHSIYHGNWDGYTDFTPQQAEAHRLLQGKDPETYLGTLDDFTAALQRVNPAVRAGCVNDELDKRVMPDAIVYDTCSGLANHGPPGQREGDAESAQKGINEYVTTGTISGIPRKWLAHYQMTDLDRQQAALEVYKGLAGDVVYGMVTHALANQASPLYAFLDYLATADPSGARSRTVSEVITSRVLPEQAVSEELLDPQVQPGQPPSGGKCGDGICDQLEQANPQLCPSDCP